MNTDVPGATLYYEVQGSGPTLLLIPGGPLDSSAFAGIAPLLADEYTVVTYDPRGLSRSTRTDPDEDVSVDTQADDALRLLDAVGAEPAHVFGHSGGALTAFNLVARHPDRVRTLVAMEPPVTELLPDRDKHRADEQAIHDAYRRDGVWAGLGVFMAQAGLDDDGAEQSGGPSPAEMAAMRPNFEMFLGHMLAPMSGYLPDADALRAAPTKIVIGTGTTTVGDVAHRAALAVAKLLDVSTVDFPGDHNGFSADPEANAKVLREVLH